MGSKAPKSLIIKIMFLYINVNLPDYTRFVALQKLSEKFLISKLTVVHNLSYL